MSFVPAFIPTFPLRINSTRPLAKSRQSRVLPRSCASPLSARAQSLIQEQLASPLFDTNKPPAELSGILSRAQEGGAFLEASKLPSPGGAKAQAADAIRVHASVSIDAARATVLREYPGIDQPGGALYPEQRAIACWRDLSEFARVVSYGVAVGDEVFSDKGVEIMKMVYEELQVPMDAMVTAVSALGKEISDRVGDEPEIKMEIGKGFAGLLEVLEGF